MDERSDRPERLGRRSTQIPDEELWRAHERCRERLVGWARQTLQASSSPRRGAATTRSRSPDEVLDPEALTIGFARRFATYKRGALLLRDPDRLRRLLEDTKRPIQFVFAGKAHPADHEGKELIKAIVNFARDPADPPANRVHRKLRHERRAVPRAGRGRVAQHAAAAVRSLRHQRHEGGRQRRARTARSSTAGGSKDTIARRRLGDRPRRDVHRRRATRTSSRARRSTTSSRSRSSRCSTSAASTTCRASGSRG